MMPVTERLPRSPATSICPPPDVWRLLPTERVPRLPATEISPSPDASTVPPTDSVPRSPPTESSLPESTVRFPPTVSAATTLDVAAVPVEVAVLEVVPLDVAPRLRPTANWPPSVSARFPPMATEPLRSRPMAIRPPSRSTSSVTAKDPVRSLDTSICPVLPRLTPRLIVSWPRFPSISIWASGPRASNASDVIGPVRGVRRPSRSVVVKPPKKPSRPVWTLIRPILRGLFAAPGYAPSAVTVTWLS